MDRGLLLENITSTVKTAKPFGTGVVTADVDQRWQGLAGPYFGPTDRSVGRCVRVGRVGCRRG